MEKQLPRAGARAGGGGGVSRAARGCGDGCDVSQGTSGPDPTTVFVDMRALRHDR